MTYVGIRQLKAQLSKYVRSARGGEDVVVTDHGKPVARLVNSAISKDARPSLASLAAEGLVILPTRRSKPLRRPVVFNVKGKLASDIIIEDRR